MPGYADAWRLSGAPAHHERTINTFARHKIDSQTNFFYFVPNDEQEDLNETAPGTDSVTCGTATIRPSEGTDALVGTRVSLFDPSPFPDANHSNNNDSGRAIPLTSAASAGGTSKPSSFSVPQVAGRFQRCFFRSLSSRHHKKEYPLMRRYARKQLLVLRPFTEVTLSEREARMYNRGGDYRAHCSASDTYPILVLLA
uniref:WGS project CAEQ00000000 data, annotated contig 1926 n=1 Tax=Trypanosoma congolense (strain IL3000) TaxID=1068625 RepID=F9WA37_TRYCI|nr:unnamed protein product [Trypanosoma congolense IL3000]